MDHGTITPTRKDLRYFPLVFLALFALLGALVLWRPGGLLVGAAILSGAWIIALVFDADHRARNVLGFVIPTLLGIPGGLIAAGVAPHPVAYALFGTGAAGAALFALSRGAGGAVYAAWMRAAMPIGWAISHTILLTIWSLVVTPIGLLMRMCGKDPLQRTLDPEADSYWSAHRPGADVSRYLKQY